MEGKNRNLLIVLIAAVIVVGVFASFGLNLFTGGTPTISLPTPVASAAPQPGDSADHGDAIWVEVTIETVQEVIRTLERPDSYTRTVVLQDHWGEDKVSATTANVTVDGGWTLTEAKRSNGSTRTSVVGDGMLRWWYDDERMVQEAPADEYSADLEGQRIPTYEDILSAEPAAITYAGYEAKNGTPCIAVAIEIKELGYQEWYWVSVENGLLTAAETVQDGVVLMEMSAGAVEIPAPAGTEFMSPDRVVYHRVGD